MLTRQLGGFIARAAKEGVPSDARETAKISVIDTVAVMLAGRRENAVALISGALGRGEGRAVEVHGWQKVSPESAALINGVASHVLDYDDVALRGHPGAVLVPALLALGAHGRLPGSRLLDAYVIGYQVWADLVFRDEDIHHLKGWHPTGVFGTVASAAACAALLGLDEQAATHAVGLGASMSARLMANFGSMAKPLHAGRAAQSGVLAARLGMAGFTAGHDVLEHEQGFLKAFSPSGRVDVAQGGKEGHSWSILQHRVSVKKYPTCYYTHRAIDAMLMVRSRITDMLDEVARIDVHMSREHATVLRNHQPQDALAAKFSIEFAMACALLHGRVSLFQLHDDVVRSEAIQSLMKKVQVTHVDRYSPTWKGAAIADQVFITLTNGVQVVSEPVGHATGDAANPLARRELENKFMDCLEASCAPAEPGKMLDMLWNLEHEHVHTLWSREDEIH